MRARRRRPLASGHRAKRAIAWSNSDSCASAPFSARAAGLVQGEACRRGKDTHGRSLLRLLSSDLDATKLRVSVETAALRATLLSCVALRLSRRVPAATGCRGLALPHLSRRPTYVGRGELRVAEPSSPSARCIRTCGVERPCCLRAGSCTIDPGSPASRSQRRIAGRRGRRAKAERTRHRRPAEQRHDLARGAAEAEGRARDLQIDPMDLLVDVGPLPFLRAGTLNSIEMSRNLPSRDLGRRCVGRIRGLHDDRLDDDAADRKFADDRRHDDYGGRRNRDRERPPCASCRASPRSGQMTGEAPAAAESLDCVSSAMLAPALHAVVDPMVA